MKFKIGDQVIFSDENKQKLRESGVSEEMINKVYTILDIDPEHRTKVTKSLCPYKLSGKFEMWAPEEGIQKYE